MLEEILAQPDCNPDKYNRYREMEGYYADLMGYYGQAIELSLQSINHYKKHYPYSTSTNMIQRNVARLYRKIGLPSQAIQQLENILEQERLSPMANSLIILKSMNSLGELHRDAGSYEKALDYYQYTLELVLKLRGEQSFSAGSVTNNIGETYYALGNYQEALKWHQRSLTIRLQLDKHPYRTNSYDNLGMTYLKLGELEQAEQYIMKAYELREQETKSIYYSAFHIKSQLHLAALAEKKGNISAALQHYKQAIEINRGNLKEDYISKHRAYNLIGNLQLSQSNWQEASQTFNQALHQTISKEELRGNLQQHITIKHSGQVLTSLIGNAQAIAHQYDGTQDRAFLYEAFDYYKLSIELANKIRQSYSSQKDKLNMSRQTITLYKNAALLSDRLYQLTQDEKYLEALFQISEQSKAGILLDAQNQHMADKTGVLPDSLLEQEHRLAALNSYYQQQINTSTEKEQQNVWKQKHFENQRKKETLSKKIEQRDNLGKKFRSTVGPLVHNQREVKHIHQKFEGEVFLGKAALERQFKTKLADYSILHLAMHALIDNEDPSNSCLVFTHQQDSIEDNFLHVYELYNMELSADLVVLSACNTGLGKLEGGEGFMSLGRAFAYAGCPSVVMSHWKVDDLATSKLMDYFYDELAKGLDKSTALQTAKIHYLEQATPRETAPFLWGSFVLMGDDIPIKIIQPSVKWPYFLIGFLLVALVIGVKVYIRKTSA